MSFELHWSYTYVFLLGDVDVTCMEVSGILLLFWVLITAQLWQNSL